MKTAEKLGYVECGVLVCSGVTTTCLFCHHQKQKRKNERTKRNQTRTEAISGWRLGRGFGYYY